jgi:hypothetical protein
MAKIQHKVALIGILPDGLTAKTHQTELVEYFTDKKNNFKIHKDNINNRSLRLETKKGLYDIPISITHKNMYMGEANGIKVHVNIKKISGKIIYWAEPKEK